MKRHILTAFFVLLSAACLYAETATLPDASLPVADGTPIPLTRAVVTSLLSNGTIEIQEAGKTPARFAFAPQPVFIAADGKMFEPSPATLSRGTKVLVHFMPDGGKMIIDRVILQ